MSVAWLILRLGDVCATLVKTSSVELYLRKRLTPFDTAYLFRRNLIYGQFPHKGGGAGH